MLDNDDNNNAVQFCSCASPLLLLDKLNIKNSESFSVMLHLTYIVIIFLFYFFGKVRSNFVVLIS